MCRFPTKSNFVSCGMMSKVLNCIRRSARAVSRRVKKSMNARVTTMEVNIEATRPMMRVTAKPRTGPEPYCMSTTPATSVVTWLSTMVQNDLVVALLHRLRGRFAAAQLLADALVDEHVRVDRHAERQHEAGDAGQRQRRAPNDRHDGEHEQAVEDQRQVGDEPGAR